MVRKILGGIVMYSLLIYVIIEFGPQFDFHALTINPPESLRSTPVFLLIGGVFWLIYDIMRHIIKIIAIPLNRITFGLTNTVVNIGMIYVFTGFIQYIDIGVSIQTGSIIEVAILAFILGIFSLFIKYI